MAKKVLILGGTTEARTLASRLDSVAGFAPITSLAGVTSQMPELAGDMRVGRFESADALQAYLREADIDCLVDASHPFACQISEFAALAARRAEIPVLRIERPEWRAEDSDQWSMHDDLQSIVEALPPGACVFAPLGRRGLEPLIARKNLVVFTRSIEPVDYPERQGWRHLLARPPFDAEDEFALMKRYGITHLVTRNAGGEATYGKLLAARALGLPVFLLKRPEKPAVPIAESVAAAHEVLHFVFSAPDAARP